ncbi:sulfatase [Salinarchaeum sp. Harcht-Bsk1]|uniref:sulfatase n=1 Tax=Salinarchaeum sp. Harcht-Bsk1 TaxID=1333523 RepID=UPI00034232E4|nr:sulfatase [Salinarchaeum sp. Harcht-Bsk1]AGN00941.1 sulfatase [Salinarchaeum sp. Harcht-Bsk1]
MKCQNALLITIDSLRADAVGSTRYGESVTPRLDEVIESGVQFTNAAANGSSTPSSFPSILTSTYPLMYGGYQYLNESRPFLAEHLSNEGFVTVAYHSNPHLGPNMNYDRGFDSFNDIGGDTNDSDMGLINRAKNYIEERIDNNSLLYSWLRRGWHLFSMSTGTAAYANATTITDNAIDWLEERDRDRRFFLWLHYMDVHYPFMPPRRHLQDLVADLPKNRQIARINGQMHENPEGLSDRDLLLDLYHGEVKYTDYEIGRLLDKLSEQGVLNETHVTITADHGESFGEHGYYGHHPNPYDELVRVPLIMNNPNSSHMGTVSDQVELADIGPTIYDSLNVSTPDAVQGDTVNKLLSDAGGRDDDDRVAICTGSPTTLASRTNRWKLIWWMDSDELELFDLRNDPKESEDVSTGNPEVVDRMKSILDDHLEEVEASEADNPNVSVSRDTKDRLRDLGYVE